MHAGAGEVDLCDVIALLNQLMLRFKATLRPLMQEVRMWRGTALAAAQGG